jgi:hypothetical protein
VRISPRKLSGRAMAALLAITAIAVLAASAHAADDPWSKGASWVSIRAGYAKSLSTGAPNGFAGYGFGYSHFLSDRLSFGVFVHHELLGKFGGAAEIEVPMTAEYAWHFKWKTPLHPYLGGGVGAFYHQVYRSGADRAHFLPATVYKFGVDAPLDRHSVLGIDMRVASVASDDETHDPVFGTDRPHSGRWSAKLNYARAF